MDALHALAQGEQAYQGTYRNIFPAEKNVPKDGLAVSEEEYWERYYNDPDFVYEWNNGYLEVKPMSDQKGSETYQWFCDIIGCYIRTYPVGRISNLEIGFHLALPRKSSNRIPDLAVVLNDNPVRIDDDDRRYDGTFDLCVESLSHSSKKEIERDTDEKKKEYEGVGVKEYYILDARGTETAFYRRGRHGKYEHIRPMGNDIIRSGILPGFQFRISDLYSRPPLERLAEDRLYYDYVFPSHKEVRLRAEQAENLAQQEAARAAQAESLAQQEAELRKQAENFSQQEAELRKQAENLAQQEAELRKQEAARAAQAENLAQQERLRAERLSEKLRAMGIDPDEF